MDVCVQYAEPNEEIDKKKNKKTKKSNPLHDFFQGIWQSKNKLIEIRQLLEISLEKQKTDGQDGIQQ